MEYNEFFPWVFTGIVATLMFFAQRWIARIDHDREALQRVVKQLQDEAMLSKDAQRWIERLDRDREKLERRVMALSDDLISKKDVMLIHTEFKKDLNIRFAELRDDVQRKYDHLLIRQDQNFNGRKDDDN